MAVGVRAGLFSCWRRENVVVVVGTWGHAAMRQLIAQIATSRTYFQHTLLVRFAIAERFPNNTDDSTIFATVRRGAERKIMDCAATSRPSHFGARLTLAQRIMPWYTNDVFHLTNCTCTFTLA
uniref:Secreted protein n=1 Tax=Romanomermis culicivorax TaxID=13658 RepID=A0A915KNE3_ROMCU